MSSRNDPMNVKKIFNILNQGNIFVICESWLLEVTNTMDLLSIDVPYEHHEAQQEEYQGHPQYNPKDLRSKTPKDVATSLHNQLRYDYQDNCHPH